MRKLVFLSATVLALILLCGAPVQGQPDARVVPTAKSLVKKEIASSSASKVATKDATKRVEPKSKTKPKVKAETKLPNVDSNKPGEILQLLVTAFKEGKWAWGVGLILMILTLLFNKALKGLIPKKVVPWVAIGLGVATSTMTSLASGVGWLSAIGTGLTVGLAAVGGWEAIGKLFKKKKTETEKAETAKS